MNIDMPTAAKTNWDLIVIGGGPAGCQAALFGGTEGMNTLLVEPSKIGGQIGQTPHLENLIGYEYGVSGACLSATMETQLLRLGVHILSAKADKLEAKRLIVVDSDSKLAKIPYKTAMIATGRSWDKVDMPSHGKIPFHMGPFDCLRAAVSDNEVMVVGGGNSAAQGILALAARAKLVHIVCRSQFTASTFLGKRIGDLPNIRIYEYATVRKFMNDKQAVVSYKDENGKAQEATIGSTHVFFCAASKPNTEWLQGSISLNNEGLIRTGMDGRLANETSMMGVFAAGDVRESNAHRRVAHAMGDATVAIGQIQERLYAKA